MLTLLPTPGRYRPHCHGYACGCVCAACSQRQRGVESGRLFYGPDGKLKAHKRSKRQPWEKAA